MNPFVSRLSRLFDAINTIIQPSPPSCIFTDCLNLCFNTLINRVLVVGLTGTSI